MPTEADFLAAIRADPDDDGPRLVFADWCEEQGRAERAELIRVQCALAKLPPFDGVVILGDHEIRRRGDFLAVTGEIKTADLARVLPTSPPGSPIGRLMSECAVTIRFGKHEARAVLDEGHDYPYMDRARVWFILLPQEHKGDVVRLFWEYEDREEMLRRHSDELLSADSGKGWTNRCAWFDLFHHFCPPNAHRFGWEFRRGFVEDIRIQADHWLAHGDAILTWHPVRRVELTTWSHTVADNVIHRWLEKVGTDKPAGILFSSMLEEIWPGVTFVMPTECFSHGIISSDRRMSGRFFGDLERHFPEDWAAGAAWGTGVPANVVNPPPEDANYFSTVAIPYLDWVQNGPRISDEEAADLVTSIRQAEQRASRSNRRERKAARRGNHAMLMYHTRERRRRQLATDLPGVLRPMD